jgi:hypothetical protein
MCLRSRRLLFGQADLGISLYSMHTFVLRAADFAGQECFAAGVGFEQVAAVGAEDEGSNGGHVCGLYVV